VSAIFVVVIVVSLRRHQRRQLGTAPHTDNLTPSLTPTHTASYRFVNYNRAIYSSVFTITVN